VCVLWLDAQLNEHELLAWLTPKVARYKIPKRVFFGRSCLGQAMARSPKI
jgi:hypothetical protein